jgi:hypothetical protein
MKKPPEIPKPKTVPFIEPGVRAERTQKPPSEELISSLNQLASKPPFSYRHKVKENDPL